MISKISRRGLEHLVGPQRELEDAGIEMRVRERRIVGLLEVNWFLLEDLLTVLDHLREVELIHGHVAREGKSKASDQDQEKLIEEKRDDQRDQDQGKGRKKEQNENERPDLVS